MQQRLGAAAIIAALVVVCTGCGSDSGSDPDADAFSAAADTTTCVADATAVTSTPEGYPQDFPMPAGTVVFNVEDRGADGVIATGTTATAFEDVLAALNGPAQQAGFKVTNGETEADDAEANWSGNGYTGRWAIKESASCPGETVIQLLSKRG